MSMHTSGDGRRFAANLELITPEIAKKYLAANAPNQRKVSVERVTSLAVDMKSGRFHVTGETLIFDEHDRLANGQHRLQACIQSGASFETFVIRGVSEEAFDVLDSGKARTPGDVLHQHAIKNSNAIAASVRLVLGYESGTLQGTNYATSRQDLVAEAQTHREEYASAAIAGKLARPLVASAVTAFIVLAKRRAPSDVVDEFMDGVISGVGLEEGDPRLALRRWSVNTKEFSLIQLSALIRTWNHYVANDSMKLIKRWFRGTPFPQIAVLNNNAHDGHTTGDNTDGNCS